MPDSERNRYKQMAAEEAVRFVESGMVVGLGGGSTAAFAVQRIAELLHAGRLRDVLGVPCSRIVGETARRLGIPIVSLDAHPTVDLTIDGADEVDPALNLVKGAGGALLHEKIVAQASRREIIVVDAAKLSERLGTRAAVPVEVVPFGWRPEAAYLESLSAAVQLRTAGDGSPFLTDERNYILDCRFGPIGNLQDLAARLDARAGIVGHGLFLGLATDLVIAGPDGLRHLSR